MRRQLKPLTEEEYNDCIRKVYTRGINDLDYEHLSAVIIRLHKEAQNNKLEKLLVEKGIDSVIKDLDFYVSKVYFRNHQLQQMKKLSRRMFLLANKIGKLIPEDKKCTRARYLKFINKMRLYKWRLLEYIPKDEKKGKNK